MKKLFYATKNKYKIQNMKDRLKKFPIEIITPYDIDVFIEVNENGNTVTENAILKAKAYYEKVGITTVAGDSSLYIEEFDKQPGLHVRRINGDYLNDDELEKYYIDELDKIGGKSKAYYVTGLAIVKNNEIKTIEIKEDEFILTSQICKSDENNDPLGRLEFDENMNKYFCEMTDEDKNKRGYTFDKKCVEFITNNI